MKKIKHLLMMLLFFFTATIIAQTKILGTVVDETGEPLPGASVVEKGTTNGTATDFDGNFKLNTKSNSGSLVISFIGYENKIAAFTQAGNVGKISLVPEGNALDEVVIKGLVDVAKERETPVAVSTIKASEIQEKLGSQEFPELLNTTPSVYATKSGGGFGDARINIRGFSQENIAVLINGVPVNDMENSKVYWSNWAGLSDVTTAMQVQRGLGSSKLAISSVGGTVNIITKTTDKKQGGSVLASVGNDMYNKFLATYSTGKLENGLAASVLLSRTSGDGYVDGTKFEGYNYFIGLGWEINDAHDLQFMITGAPQVHNQRTTSFYNMATLAQYLKYGDTYNYNHGYLRGKEFNWRRNFYHKPVVSLSWNWDINENSSLSASGYVSFGRGGGTGDIGRFAGKYNYSSSSFLRNPETGQVLWDEIVRANSGNLGVFSEGETFQNTIDAQTGKYIVNDPDLYGEKVDLKDQKNFFLGATKYGNGIVRRASMNSHNWFGLLANYNVELSDELTLDFGIDLRDYTGEHYRRIDDLLGADGYRDNDNVNKPMNVVYQENKSSIKNLWNVFKDSKEEEKIDYYNDGKVRWYGAFTQLEYKGDDVSVFVQGGVSNQGFKRIDYFNYLDSDTERETDWQNFLGGNAKAGINWNINENHNIFANGGYYIKQPFFDAVFLNYKNDINQDPRNEKVLGLELGYGYKTERFSLNTNFYRTQWKDRFISAEFDNGDAEGSVDLQGVTQIHQGAELDFTYNVTESVKLLGMFSYGDWHYDGTLTGTAFDGSQNKIDDVKLDVTDVKVGNSAQTTARFGVEVKPFENFKIDFSQRFNDRLYSALLIEKSSGKTLDKLDPAIELPGYSVADLGLSYKVFMDKESNQSLNFRLNINNLFDEEYISESATNIAPNPKADSYKGINTKNKVFFGFGTTWNFSVRYNF